MDIQLPRHSIGASTPRTRTEAAAARAARRAYRIALAEAERATQQEATPPPRRTSWGWLLVEVASAIAILAVCWLVLGPSIMASLAPAPSVTPAVPTMRPVAPPAAAPAAEQAPAAPVADAQPAPVAVEAPAPVSALPTAAVVIAAPAEVVTLDPAAPLRYAPGSGPAPTAAPAPTVATTAFMQIGKDYEANADGTCVRTRRDGALVEFCQSRPMNIGEMSSVADYLRTGMIVGEKVK